MFIKRPSLLSTLLIVTCGIVLPVVTILVESLMHFCAMGYVDPLPTVGHVFALATVPLANGFALWALHRRAGAGAHIDAVIFAQAFAVAVAASYTLLFLPVMQLAALAVAFWAYGLLLTPALSFVASLRALLALGRLRRTLALPARRMVRGGLAAGVFTLALLAIPPLLTRVTPSLLDRLTTLP
jgi:hypothetical protein